MNPFFQAELNTLNEDALEFFRSNPALAPLLDGKKNDPDVELLLEALGYLVAMIRQKLACDLPKMIQMLVQLIFPQFQLPIPAITTLCLTSHATDGQSVTIPAGARFASVPVDGRKCIFTTSTDVEIHPLELTDAAFVQHTGRAGEIRLSLSLKGLSLSRWQPATPLRLRLTGDFASATELFQLLSLHLGRIVLAPTDGGGPVALPLDCLKQAGFGEGEELLPYPPNAFPGYQWLQEYFNSPEKFLSFDLDLRAHMPQLGDGMHFTISFVLDNLPPGSLRISQESFTLNTVMAINLFPHDADPVSLNHRSGIYLIRPAGPDSAHCQAYSVDQVTGYTRATAEERDYLPFDLFDESGSEPVYQALPVKSHSGYDVYLEVAYPREMPPPDTEILSIAITCTDGNLPENLHTGDITEPLTPLPDFITVRNITPVTPGQPPPLDPGLLQKLISHLCMNHLSLGSVEHLTTLLKLYASHHGSSTANLKRIDGIVAFEVTAGEQMVQGIPMRGLEIRIKMRQDHFAGAGDMYLFGCMLDRFLGGYAATNTYTRLTLNETTRGVIYRWKTRLGTCNRDNLVFKPERTYPANGISRRRFNTLVRQAGPDSASLIDDLVAHGHEYSYKQVMHIAKRTFGPGGKEHIPGVPWQKRVHIRPDLSLAFPASDVARVERNGTDLLVTTTFLGLYGSSSPMPTFYSEDLLAEAMDDSSVTRCFIDIFHQRTYLLFFECVSKYRLFNRIGEEKNLADLVRLFCLGGLGEKALRDSVPESRTMLRYIALFGQFPRSALGLQALLRDALGISCLAVEQCVLRKVKIPAGQRMSLGLTGMSLGVNTVLGSVIFDRGSKIRIHIGPLKRDEFNSFLPGTPLYDKLARLIRLYLIDPLDFDLKLILAANEAVPIRLGDPDTARLGLGTWSFSSKTLGEVSITFHIAQQVTNDPEDDFGYAPERTEPQSLIDYYNQEMANLRDLIARYVEIHPEMAPMVSGNMPDQGVERVMEGDAYLGGRLQQKLGDDLPEVIHGVMDVVQPNSLKHFPSTATIVFTPKASCTDLQVIPAGTELKSVPVDGTECRFTTCYPVEMHPLAITNVSFAQPSGKPPAITLSLKLTGIALSKWKANKLRLFLAGERNHALNLYLVLMRYLKRIVITPALGGQPVALDATHLKAVGFEDADILFPSGASGADSLQIVHEYFIQLDKYLLLDLLLEKWRERGEGTEFEIRFELDKLPFALHQVGRDDFSLFATLAVNVFKHWAEPIVTGNSQNSEYQVKPTDGHFGHYDIYSVESVAGLLNNTSNKISFTPGQQGNPQSQPVTTYHVKRQNSAIRNGLDFFISIEAPQKIISNQITSLVVELACTNGRLPERLRTGDICMDSDSSPGFAEFTNCKPVTRSECINLGSNTLWRLYSLCNINIALLNVKSLRSMLELVSQAYNHDYTTAKLNTDRIRGITDLQIKPTDRLMGRSVLRGWEIRIGLDSKFYDSPGDLFLFGTLLDHFLRGFATESCFTRTIVEDVRVGKTYEWPVKMGKRALV